VELIDRPARTPPTEFPDRRRMRAPSVYRKDRGATYSRDSKNKVHAAVLDVDTATYRTACGRALKTAETVAGRAVTCGWCQRRAPEAAKALSGRQLAAKYGLHPIVHDGVAAVEWSEVIELLRRIEGGEIIG
jgi:hypothetical protein